MSVLIEACSLVVPRKVLDSHYPGGTDAYLSDAAANNIQYRYALADEQLTVMSFLDPHAADPLLARLNELGVVHVDGDMAVETVFVDQHFGPMMPCPWLKWEMGTEGFTRAWADGREPGELAAPEGWTAEDSKGLERSDIRDEPGRAMRIASENGLETWIDFQTGDVIRGLPHRKEVAPVPAPPASAVAREKPDSYEAPGPIMQTLMAAVENRGWNVATDHAGLAIDTQVKCDKAVFRLYARVEEEFDVLGIFTQFPGFVPEDRRDAVSNFLTRVNFGRKMGNFELDFSDGEVRFRTSIDVEGGLLGEPMVQNMLSNALWASNHFYDALQRVVYANVAPAVAIADLAEASE